MSPPSPSAEHTQPLAEQAHALWRRNRLRRNNQSGLVGVARYERSAEANRHKNSGAVSCPQVR